MTLSLNSKEGRSIVSSLASSPAQSAELSPEAGRNIIGVLGFRLVSLARQMIQSPSAYQSWLMKQRERVAKEFIAICKHESNLENANQERIQLDNKSLRKTPELSKSSLDKLKSQSGQWDRPRVMTPKEFKASLTPSLTTHKSAHYSGWQRLLVYLNPFDQEGEADQDWLSQFRSSGQALKIELTEGLESYYDLLQSNWDPADVATWVSIGAHLVQLNDELSRLCQAAEELVLDGHAKEAGFNLTLIFSLLRGLTSERAILTHVIAHPNLIQTARSWNEAVAKARAI